MLAHILFTFFFNSSPMCVCVCVCVYIYIVHYLLKSFPYISINFHKVFINKI